MAGGIGERLRHRIAGAPCLDIAILDRVAEEMDAGASVRRVDIRTAFFQPDF
jgi:hypothetical protein